MTGAVKRSQSVVATAELCGPPAPCVGLVGGYATLVVDPGLIIPDLLVVSHWPLVTSRLLRRRRDSGTWPLVWSWLLATTQSTAIPALPGELHAARPAVHPLYYVARCLAKGAMAMVSSLLAGALALLLAGLALYSP